MTIRGRNIGEEHDFYVIAECGNNHNGSVDAAIEMIRTAARCGAHAVKFQKRTLEYGMTKAMRNAPYENENSFGRTYGEHRAYLELSRGELSQCVAEAHLYDIACGCTAFDIPAINDVVASGCDFIKIASGCYTDIPLIRECARTGLPLVASIPFPAASQEDIDRIITAAQVYGKGGLVLLHCVPLYPCPAEALNLSRIRHLVDTYDVPVGVSDHYAGIQSVLESRHYGACCAEKHFTLNRASKGTDHAFSLEPQGLQKLCDDLKKAERMLIGDLDDTLCTKSLCKMGKSVWPAYPVGTGRVLSPGDIALKSPRVIGACEPYEYGEILGRVTLRDLSTSHPIWRDDVE